MKKYSIFDTRKGLLADPVIVCANTPKEAVERAGYINVRRDERRDGCAPVIVRSARGTYGYYATLPRT